VPPKKRTTTAKGLGWTHQKQRAALMAKHVDGTLCPCQPGCGPGCPCVDDPLPMYRDPRMNIDGRPLAADHQLSRSQGGTRANRLLLATCNESRGDGTREVPLVTSRDW